MDAFNADLNEALRYHTEQERKSFEDAIDANPLDSTTHLVYADWLQEQGEHEEAEFRRAMGEWHSSHNYKWQGPHQPELAKGIGHPTYQWAPRMEELPKGITAEAIRSLPSAETSYYDKFRGSRLWPDNRLYWEKYRDMESAFRRAFKAGRQPTSE